MRLVWALASAAFFCSCDSPEPPAVIPQGSLFLDSPHEHQPAPPPLASKDPGVVTFAQLADFTFEPPAKPKSGKTSIPESILALSGKTLTVEGYAIPVRAEDGRVQSFILCRYFTSCCFGEIPKFNEYIEVKTADEYGIELELNAAILVTGTLEVGEFWEDGLLVGIYRMTADYVEDSTPD